MLCYSNILFVFVCLLLLFGAALSYFATVVWTRSLSFKVIYTSSSQFFYIYLPKIAQAYTAAVFFDLSVYLLVLLRDNKLINTLICSSQCVITGYITYQYLKMECSEATSVMVL